MFDLFLSQIENCFDELFDLELQLCRIPSPTRKEQKKAEFVRDWLLPYGPVRIDEANNCIFSGFDDGGDDALIISAHTDTVFPDLEPFEPVIDGDILRCPGCGDDTANLAAMMILIKYLALSGLKPQRPVIFAAVSCEEGLGNLDGAKKLIETFGDRTGAYISLDGDYDSIVDSAVGSYRYRITVKAPGGHSYSRFGNTNAIAVISELITELYKVQVPEKARTTYNVGTIEGGTSVNTIAQSVCALYEYRSEDRECLTYMSGQFEAAVNTVRGRYDDAQITAEILGVRPCTGDVDPAALKELADTVETAIRAVVPGDPLPHYASSTDCNIPLSVGIPAACFGLVQSSGAHTREEYLQISSMKTGIRISAELLRNYFR